MKDLLKEINKNILPPNHNNIFSFEKFISEDLSIRIEEELLNNQKMYDFFDKEDYWIKINESIGGSWEYSYTLSGTKRIKHIHSITYAHAINKNIIAHTLGNNYFGIITPFNILEHKWKIHYHSRETIFECEKCKLLGVKRYNHIIPGDLVPCKNRIINDIID